MVDGAPAGFSRAEIHTAWNLAEKTIKQAEQVSAEVVVPAIQELRYAGRRFVEADAHEQKGEDEEAKRLLSDAYFFCCRAQHDAIDAATAKISLDLGTCVNGVTPADKVAIFPEYNELLDALISIEERVAQSRENREDRQHIYETLAKTDFERIIELHKKFRRCEPELSKLARKASRAWLGKLAWTIGAAMLGFFLYPLRTLVFG
ncbi:hypothetical protein HY29_15430 [Hyphomonas beringensis]|uniref:Uncharacterized protein n=1 Tax=Hyphomonas beringensis TaxID=1280946 RepID=A0A062U779_9PROT|nr:hypothetical protein [Hyphomonas beringensis]KCZ54132.1 hypothetical protein HY29_15430 [Hyphomonas beringensis]